MNMSDNGFIFTSCSVHSSIGFPSCDVFMLVSLSIIVSPSLAILSHIFVEIFNLFFWFWIFSWIVYTSLIVECVPLSVVCYYIIFLFFVKLTVMVICESFICWISSLLEYLNSSDIKKCSFLRFLLCPLVCPIPCCIQGFLSWFMSSLSVRLNSWTAMMCGLLTEMMCLRLLIVFFFILDGPLFQDKIFRFFVFFFFHVFFLFFLSSSLQIYLLW